MRYQVSLTDRAERDRETAYRWYATNYSEEYAVRWFNGITRAMHSLSKHPDRCHKADENSLVPFDLYEMIYGQGRSKHRVLFRIHRDIVVVVHIRHSAQDYLTASDF